MSVAHEFIAKDNTVIDQQHDWWPKDIANRAVSEGDFLVVSPPSGRLSIGLVYKFTLKSPQWSGHEYVVMSSFHVYRDYDGKFQCQGKLQGVNQAHNCIIVDARALPQEAVDMLKKANEDYNWKHLGRPTK